MTAGRATLTVSSNWALKNLRAVPKKGKKQ